AQLPERTGADDFRHFEWYYLWHACRASVLTLRTPDEGIMSVAASPDGRYLVSAGPKTVVLWHATTGQAVHTIKGHESLVRGVAFDAGSKRLAGASEDRTVKIWDLADGRETVVLNHRFPVHAVAFRPDGKSIVCVDRRTVTEWDSDSGKKISSS